MSCSPQRFLANNRNLFATATITPSSVLPVENKVLPIPFARTGTARAILAGAYTGAEEAIYEVEIIDTDVEVARISSPTRSGEGTETISDIAATGTQQIYTVECTDSGVEGQHAAVPVEGVQIKALEEGPPGNLISIDVDQSGLVYTDSSYSTLVALSAGQGGPTSPLIGAGFNWGQATLDANGLIPASAIRIAFKGDPNVYLPYRKFVDGDWQYFTVPALKADVPKGTIIQTVTGGRTVVITNGTDIETQSDIVTAYDLLNWIRTTSTLVYVDGVVANDRSPTGQASRELSLRTDAHAEASTGSGSQYATGFSNITVAADAATQLVTAQCYAVNPQDHPNARLGGTLWSLKSSILGDLGTIREGVPYSGSQFGLTIEQKLPPGHSPDQGSIGYKVDYVTRADDETEPGICVAGLRLGSEATNKSITFKYAPEPAGDCDCSRMPGPHLSTACLGVPTEGESVSYQDDTNERLVLLRAFVRDLCREMTEFGKGPYSELFVGAGVYTSQTASLEAPALDNPSDNATAYYAQQTLSIKAVADEFEAAIAQIDPLDGGTGSYREAGFTAWDAAFARFQADIEATIGSASPPAYYLLNIPSSRYTEDLKWALASAGIANVGKTDAGTVAGDGCWRDWGGPRWIDVDGVYGPIWTNHPFILVRRTSSGAYISTHEAGGQINVVPDCIVHLKYGDTITINIDGAGQNASYQVGDELSLPIVAAAPLFLTGGVAGVPTQTWSVSGSVNGALDQYIFNADSPTPYSYTGGGVTLSFLISEGGIPAVKGDRFRFAVEGGHLRWRKDSGAWDETSPPIPIPLDTVTLDSGLELSFAAGASASFVEGDVYKFKALQPWAASNAQYPTDAVWRWDGDDAEYPSGDLGETKQFDMVAVLCDLPDGATLTFSGGATNTADDWSEPITVRSGCSWKAIDREARYVKLTFANAPDGSMQWAFAGSPVATSLSSEIHWRRGYLMNRPGGNLQGGRFQGKTVHGLAEWTESAMSEADMQAIVDMLDHVKENDDEPIIVIAQVTRDDDELLRPMLARIASDDVDFPDHFAYNQNKGIARRVSASLPLEGVWQ